MAYDRHPIALAVAAFVAVSGCSPTPPAPSPATVAPTVAAYTPKPPLSVNEMMVMIVDHPGELLWNIEKPGKAPKTDEAWWQLESHADEIAASSVLIRLGGTGPSDAAWASNPDWQKAAEKLTTAALAARAAAKAKALPALLIANG